ncbi:hypothetical protein GCM10027613_20170 [Microlunatus endophyticus]
MDDGLAPGDGVALPLPGGADTSTRLVALQESPPRPNPVPAVTRYRVTALLGTIARLLWAMARESDRIRALRPVLADQRTTAGATGAGLDLIGADLYVPRFPPMPYAVDDDTIALYHLDDPAAALDAVDGFPGHAAHPGVPAAGAALGSVGRYGGGLWLAAGVRCRSPPPPISTSGEPTDSPSSASSDPTRPQPSDRSSPGRVRPAPAGNYRSAASHPTRP